MEIKVPKEVRQYHESIFFGLSLRQFGCSLAAVGAAVGLYFGCVDTLGTEATGWVCILGAAPLALAGFFTYNGMPLEKFLWAVFKSQVRRARPRDCKAPAARERAEAKSPIAAAWRSPGGRNANAAANKSPSASAIRRERRTKACRLPSR